MTIDDAWLAERERILADRISCERIIDNAGTFDNYTDVPRARLRLAEIDQDAHNALPLLIAEVRRLRAEIAALKAEKAKEEL